MTLDPEKQYTAYAWFVAGYVAAVAGYEDDNEDSQATGYVDTQTALNRASDAYDRYREGKCLACRREGVALMDGYFCGGCHPNIGSLINDG